MIPFRPLELEDKELVKKYTFVSSRRNCDLCFTNLFSWRFLYQTELAEWKGFLLFRFYVEQELTYMMPVGAGCLEEVLLDLQSDALHKGATLRLAGICKDMLDIIEGIFPSKFEFTTDRDYADYIYLRTDLASLKGKKYQPKRNHINRFKNRYPDYVYKPLTKELIPECIRLESQWCKANDCAENEALQAERRSMQNVLENMDALDIQGGVLFAEGRIVAFTYGSPINPTTFDTCVEKANADVEGAYSMINYEFANSLPGAYLYINREEDLGLEGLRKAKLSYNPDTILEKYNAVLR